MAITVKLDLEDVFELKPSFLDDERISTFVAPLVDGSSKLLKIEIDNEAHPLLPNVYNLAFGPMMRSGNIDDKAQLKHTNYSRVFSTILMHATIYLDRNRTHYLGVDGSSNGRAYLYYRFIQRNFDYLNKHFNVYGLKYYVRIARLGKTQYQNPFNFEDIQSSFEKIQQGKSIDSELMYNYFVFNLKSIF